MTKEELKEMIRQNILNELAEEITEDIDVEDGDPDAKLAPLYADFYEGLEEAEEEVEDVEKVDVNIDEPAAAEPTLTDTEKEIQGHLNQALYAAQEMGNESTAEDKEKLIQQIGNTIKFFTSDFVVKEADEMEEGKKEDLNITEDITADIEKKIKSGEIDPKEVEAAAKKAMSGDSTDLALMMAGFGKMFEAKKEYYKDAEADDAEHIDALEKDMKDDKRSAMNESLEILKMKKLAGLLKEGEYAKALLKENTKYNELKPLEDILLKKGYTFYKDDLGFTGKATYEKGDDEISLFKDYEEDMGPDRGKTFAVRVLHLRNDKTLADKNYISVEDAKEYLEKIN
jgi:hypothetical protein